MSTDYSAYRPWATDRQNEIIDLLESGLSQRKAAKTLGVRSRTVEKSLKNLKIKASKSGFAPEHGQTKPAPFGQLSSGTSTLYDSDGNIKQQWVKTKEDNSLANSLIAFMDEYATDYKAASLKIKAPKSTSKKLLTIYPLGDPHFGMRAWAKETGGDNFDTDIAEKELTAALKVLISSSPDSHTGILCNLGDLFHADGLKPLTPESGHILDTDGRLSHTIDAAARTFRNAIDLMLQKHKKVILMNIRGNHDPTMGLFFNKLMQAFYENNSRVEVMDNENKFLTYEWGDVSLFVHHGDKINNARAYEAITRDYSDLWGRTKYRFFHKGHIHHHTIEERGGLLMESHQTMAAQDAWHASSGYGAGRSASSITYDKDFGEVHRSKCNLALARSII